MKLRSAGAASAALAAGVSTVRRVGRRSGVTTRELGAPLPGDEIVESPLWQSTRAITIAASPGEVWPWIAQMGYPRFRAGWYTPHWLDRLQWGIREHSAERIRPELQDIRVGDRIPDSPDWSVFFTVARAEPGRALVLRSTRHLLPPMRSIDFTWALVLDAAGPGSTRLTMRARATCEPRAAWLALGALIGVGDYANATAMLRGIKRRCECGDHAPTTPPATLASIVRGAGAGALAAALFAATPLLRPFEHAAHREQPGDAPDRPPLPEAAG